MIKRTFFLFFIIFIFSISLVNSSLNCPSNSDEFEEFKAISSAALLEFLGNPDTSKLSSNEVSDLSNFFDKYKTNWGKADCSEVGISSRSTIRQIIEKYTGVVDTGLNCRLENAKWGSGQATEGIMVTLTVDTPRCNDGAVVSFVVKEKDFTKSDDNVIKNPDNAVVSSQKATTTWKAEWQEDVEETPSGSKDDKPPEYYFTATLGSSSLNSGLLLVGQCVDADGDGYGSITCGGNDCKDNDGSIHPNRAEVCDTKDNNCNKEADEGAVCGYDLASRVSFSTGSIIATKDRCVGDPDFDLFNTYLRSPPLTNSSSGWSENLGKYDFSADGIIDLTDLFMLVDHLQGADLDKDNYDTTTCHNDCNDKDKAIKPGSTEVCDGKDNNCNRDIDEIFDRDRDKYTTCGTKTDGTDIIVDNIIDCNDNNRNINPGGSEICDSLDNNCNRETDEGAVCGYDIAKRGSFSTGSIIATKDRCVGDPDFDLMNAYIRSPALSTSSSGWSQNHGKYDFNADGKIDLTDLFMLIDNLQGFDSDNDNYDTTTCHNDCNDKDSAINPGTTEVCDGKDNNCDGKNDYIASVNDLDNSCGKDGLVATDNTRWVNVNYACQQKEEKEWNNIDYFCAEGSGCSSKIQSTKWYGTGEVKNINEGMNCRGNFCSGDTINYNLKCSNGQCSGSSSSCSTGDFCSGGYRYFGGTCDANKGSCSYNREYCPLGCSNGKCNQDPCAGVSCNNVCTAGQLGSSGYCSKGRCYYSWDYCAYGCSNGQCNPPPVNKCAGVTCKPYCNGDYKINTKCDSNNGGCVYQSSERCQYGCDAGTGQCKPQPAQQCDCRYQDRCLKNWQCVMIGGKNYLCYGGKLRSGFDNMCGF